MPQATSIDDQIQDRIQTFTAELSALVKQAALEAVQEALGGQLSAGSPKARKPAPLGQKTIKPARKGKRIRRTSEDIEKLSNTVISFVGQNPGTRLEGISAGIGIESRELKKPVADLLAAKQLKKEGQKRGTTYWVVTK